jgi:hypothetical protein
MLPTKKNKKIPCQCYKSVTRILFAVILPSEIILPTSKPQTGSRRTIPGSEEPIPNAMKKILIIAYSLIFLSISFVQGQVVLLSFDFSGAVNNSTFNTQNSTFNDSGILSSQIVRGTAIGANAASNSFRGQGFSNTGIGLTGNNRYFEFTLNAAPSNTFSVNGIYGNYSGTASFFTTTNVTVAYAYSLDAGASFTQMSSFSLPAAGNFTYTVAGPDATALSNLGSVVFRMYASGNTTTGNFGFQSAGAPGTIGLSVSGTVVPEPSTWALIGLGATFIVLRFRKKRSAAVATRDPTC